MHLTMHSVTNWMLREMKQVPETQTGRGPKSNSMVDDGGWEKEMEKEEKACRVRKWLKITKILGD